MTKKQLRQRLEDLYCGASGFRFDAETDPSIVCALGEDNLGRFLTAIGNTFALRRPSGEGLPYALCPHNLNHYSNIDTLTQFIWSQMEEQI
jgi:hypothetical protein